MGKSKDGVVWCRSREKDEEQRPFEADVKEIFQTAASKQKQKQEKRSIKKEVKCSQCWKVWRRQRNITCAVSEEYASCWVHQDSHVADEQKTSFKKTAPVSGGKDECQVRLKGRERNYWMVTEIGMLGGYGFQSQVTAGDGSDKQAKWEQDIIIEKKKEKAAIQSGTRGRWLQLKTT